MRYFLKSVTTNGNKLLLKKNNGNGNILFF